MANVVHSKELELKPGGTIRFQGEAYGSGASFFLVKSAPGQGANLHIHPYPETWIVLRGNVLFTVGNEQIEADSGQIIIGEANIPHKFVNIGTETLEAVCIHPSPIIIQEDLE